MGLFLVVMGNVKKEYSLRAVRLHWGGSVVSLPAGSLASGLCWVRWVV